MVCGWNGVWRSVWCTRKLSRRRITRPQQRLIMVARGRRSVLMASSRMSWQSNGTSCSTLQHESELNSKHYNPTQWNWSNLDGVGETYLHYKLNLQPASFFTRASPPLHFILASHPWLPDCCHFTLLFDECHNLPASFTRTRTTTMLVHSFVILPSCSITRFSTLANFESNLSVSDLLLSEKKGTPIL